MTALRTLFFKHLAIGVLIVLCLTQSGQAEGVNVPVRAGIHDRFNRMVMDWPVPVKYTMQQDNGLVTIQFTRPAMLGLAAFRAAKAPLIQNLMYENNAQGVSISFRIPDQSRVQAFWSGDSVAFDVLLMNKDKPAFSPKDNAAKPKAETATTQTPPPADAPLPADETAGPQKPEKLTLPDPVPAAPDAAAPPVTTPKTAQALPKTLAEDETDATADTISAPDGSSASIDDQTIIHIRPLNKTSLAVFVRAGRLWIALDQTPAGVTPQIEGALKPDFKLYTRQTSGPAVAFIFNLPSNTTTNDIAVRQDDLNWDVYVQPAQKTADMAPASASNFELSVDSDQSVSLVTGQDATVPTFNDDLVGDKIWVVPVRSPLLKIAVVQYMAALSLQPTLVGGLLVPLQDNLKISAKDNQIIVQTPDAALPMSSAQDRVLTADQKPQQDMLFTLKLSSFPDDVTAFEDRRQYIEMVMARSTDKTDKAIQALDLARLYLQQGYSREALGALSLAQGYLPSLAQTPAFAALQGMAYALSGNVPAAMDVLAQQNLQDNNLTILWQAYASAQDKNWEKAFLGFRTQQAFIKTYNPDLTLRLALAAAESAVETKNNKDAQNFLNMIPPAAHLNAAQKAAKNFLQASLWLQDTDDLKHEQAVTLLTAMTLGSDRYYRIKAEMRLLDVNLASGEIKTKDAVDTLEKLRFAWRGDRQEIMILQRLGEYDLADKNPLQAMTMWRQALALAQNEADKATLQKALQDEFNRLFVEGDNQGMPPLQALSLYQRFKDLMPTGEMGARGALQMADQLLRVDLVDEADAVLQDQMAAQTAPDQAVALGTKLATVRLMARNPEGAIKALDTSEQAGIAADVQNRRVLLRARALADLQKTDDALALLDAPVSPEGLSLRADIFWRLNRWSDAAHDLQDLIENVTPKTAQNTNYTALIMRLAIVKALQNDQAGLDQLNAQYSDIMNVSPQGKAFHVMTAASDDTNGLSDLQTLKSQVAGTELFEGFLKGF